MEKIILTFTINAKEYRKAKSWIKKQKEKYGPEVGAIGDRFSYEFIPTSLGDIVYINDGLTKKQKCLTDLKNFG